MAAHSGIISPAQVPVAEPAWRRRRAMGTFFVRELGQIVRGRGTLWLRSSFLLLPGAAGLLAVQFGSGRLNQAGDWAFAAMMCVNGCLAFTLNSPFSSVISAERERGTLDDLRLTGLSPFALLVGKGTGLFAGVLLLLVAQMPLAAFFAVAGGLSLRLLLSGYAIFTAVLFLLCHAGVFWSVVCRTSRQAASCSCVTMLALYLAPWALLASRGGKVNALAPVLRTPLEWLAQMSPFAAFQSAMANDRAPWTMVLFHLGAGAAFLAGGVALFEWTCCERKIGRSPGPRPPGKIGSRKTPLPRVGAHPLSWKEYYFSAGGLSGTRLRWLGYVLAWIIFSALFWDDEGIKISPFAAAACIVGGSGLAGETISAAANLFGAEVTHRTLANIAILPMTTRKLIGQKIRGYVPALLPPLAVILGGALLLGFSPAHPHARPASLWGRDAVLLPYGILQFGLVLVVTLHASLQRPRAAAATAIFAVVMANLLLAGLLLQLLDIPRTALLIAGGVASVWLLAYLLRLLPFHLTIAAAK